MRTNITLVRIPNSLCSALLEDLFAGVCERFQINVDAGIQALLVVPNVQWNNSDRIKPERCNALGELQFRPRKHAFARLVAVAIKRETNGCKIQAAAID